MNNLFQKLKSTVIEAAQKTEFRHHKWYVKYHLEIAESIAMELCDKYPEADRELVKMLVWFHDYGKMLDFDDQYQKTLTDGKLKLEELGFPSDLIDKIIHHINTSDKKINLGASNIPIEIKILSSSDGAAHLAGPFFQMFSYENPDKPVDELLQGQINKAKTDWEMKIVLPEIKKAFQGRHNLILEQNGILPPKYLS